VRKIGRLQKMEINKTKILGEEEEKRGKLQKMERKNRKIQR
jgi:hypothetical protein